jgi:hypothetical protein
VVDLEGGPPPRWVDRLCNVVRRWQDPDTTILKLFREADPDLTNRPAFLRLVADRLRDEPDLVDAWQGFSYDNRGTPSAYLHGTEVGMYDQDPQDVVHHDDRVDACADFLFRKAKSVLS